MEYRIGVEEEYQLVDAATGALRSRAREVIASDWSDEIRAEMQETTLEIGTRICESAADARDEIGRLRFHVAAATASEGLAIVAAGSHPFSGWEAHSGTEQDRYRRIRERYGRVARDEHIFGMHIHVEVPERHDRVRVMDAIRFYLPHLLALAASSPFYEREDTGYASYRMILWRRWPLSGVPPRLGSTRAFRTLTDTLLRAGSLPDERSLYWSVRPHPAYPTLEFRGCDACPRADDAGAIAALARALVAAAAEGLLPVSPWPSLGESGEHTLAAHNEWQAARYGLEAGLADPAEEGGTVPLGTAVRRLVERLQPTADALGDADALSGIDALLQRGGGAHSMRRVHREHGGFGPVVDWLAAETMLGTGLDRRAAQRELTA